MSHEELAKAKSYLESAGRIIERLMRPVGLVPGPEKPRWHSRMEDLESIYLAYPLKKGKSKGLQKLYKDVMSPEELHQLNEAVHNYRDRLIADSTEARFIKHFSTFASEWRDWIDPEHGKSHLNKSTTCGFAE